MDRNPEVSYRTNCTTEFGCHGANQIRPDQKANQSADAGISFQQFIDAAKYELNEKYQSLPRSDQFDKAGRAELGICKMTIAIAVAVKPDDAVSARLAALGAILAIFVDVMTSPTIIASEVRSNASDWGIYLLHVCNMFSQEEMRQILKPHHPHPVDHSLDFFFIQACNHESSFKVIEALTLLINKASGN